jgi:hypothetical protein
MKQYDSYILYGCHFPELFYKIITKNTSLSFFNSKISIQFQCKIYEFDVPISENNEQKKYFLAILLEQSDHSMINPHNLINLDITGFYKMLETFDIEKKEPYLISVPIVREL